MSKKKEKERPRRKARRNQIEWLAAQIADEMAAGLFGRTEEYAEHVGQYYTAAVDELLKLSARVELDAENEVFSFNSTKRMSEKSNAILRYLYSAVYGEIRSGVIREWEFANDANDRMVELAMGKGTRDDSRFARLFARNREAMDAFFSRKSEYGGLNLSQKVWKYTSQFKEEMELALSASLGRGDSAATVSRHVRQYMQEPDRLFRRVRDEKGNLKLSKRAAAYHPGPGQYRSSYKNAMRLARTETNMAYRAADNERRQQHPWIIGVEVKRSKHKYPCKICERLTGRYPKDFDFRGWHPQCRCYTTDILASEDEIIAYRRAMLNGEDVSNWQFSGQITEPHAGFQKWMKDNADRVEKAAEKGTLPYWMKDNPKYVEAAQVSQHTGQGAAASLRQAKSFVPATSLDEAKRRLVGYGFKSVELGDASIEQANTVMKAVHEESLMGKIDIDRLILKPGVLSSARVMNADQAASFMVEKATGRTTLTLQTGIFEVNQHQKLLTWEQKIEACQSRIESLRKDIDGLESRLGRNKSADRMIRQMIKDDKSKISDWEIKLRDYQKAMKGSEKVLPETIATTFEKIEDQVRCTLHHEFGHYHDYNLGYPKVGLSKDVSVYGSTARNEHFAECWAKYSMGSREIPEDMLKLFDEYTGKNAVPPHIETYEQKYKRVFVSQLNKEPELSENVRLARFLAGKTDEDVYVLPHIQPTQKGADKLRKEYFPDGVKEGKNPDLYYKRRFVDEKVMSSTEIVDAKQAKRNIQNRLRDAFKQADDAYLEIPTEYPIDWIENAVKGKLNSSSSRHVVYVKYGDELLIFR